MPNRVIFYGDPGGHRAGRARMFQPHDLDVGYADPVIPIEEQKDELADCEVLVSSGLDLTKDSLQYLPKLRLLQLMSAGFNTLDITHLRENGIEVCNNSPAIANSVAEHAVALMLMTYKRLEQGIRGVKDGAWQGHAKNGDGGIPFELAGKTVGIVGLGNIGSMVARRLRGFDTETLFYDVREFDDDYLESLNARAVSFDELLDRSHVVTAHVPLNRNTTGMFSTAEFKAMRPDAIFINTCRGPVQDEKALVSALQIREIAAAGLDVFEVEPTPLDNPLLHMDNVVVTPHLAGSSEERVDRAVVFSFENARRVLNGEEPHNKVQLME